ncbi:MAG: Crp/Fnr family transcriptional regulator [Halioglobus sp.]
MTTGYDCREIIASSPWFKGAAAECVDKLAAAATIKRFPGNSFLWTEGQKTTDIYSVLSGRLRIFKASTMGQEFALDDWEQGAWLGEQTLDRDAPQILGVRVLVPSDILMIPRQTVLDVGEVWPEMYRNLFHQEWVNTRGLYVILEGMLFYPLRARVAGRVLGLLSEHGQVVSDGVLIDIKMSQNDFARLSMGSRQRVNRIFRDWDKLGFVETRGDHLLVKDIAGLENEVVPFD